jgi:hypothetical protein
MVLEKKAIRCYSLVVGSCYERIPPRTLFKASVLTIVCSLGQ